MKQKNKIVIINVGIPGSGKSTETREFLGKNPDYVAVERDAFRGMFRNSGVTEPKIESMITELMEDAIVKALKRGLNVIVDNTNLKAKYIREILELVKYKADVQYRIFDVPLKTCIERDSKRPNPVGETVITAMHKDYKILIDCFPFQSTSKRPAHEDRFVPAVQDKTLPEAVIFDIDGNLSLLGRRSEYDWDKVDVDDPNDIVIEQIHFNKNKGRKIILVSGRDESAREKTEYWMEFYGVYYDELYMRPKDDMRKDYIIKKEIYKNDLKDKYQIISVFDDRLQVVKKAWGELGLFCFCTNQLLKDF